MYYYTLTMRGSLSNSAGIVVKVWLKFQTIWVGKKKTTHFLASSLKIKVNLYWIEATLSLKVVLNLIHAKAYFKFKTYNILPETSETLSRPHVNCKTVTKGAGVNSLYDHRISPHSKGPVYIEIKPGVAGKSFNPIDILSLRSQCLRTLNDPVWTASEVGEISQPWLSCPCDYELSNIFSSPFLYLKINYATFIP